MIFGDDSFVFHLCYIFMSATIVFGGDSFVFHLCYIFLFCDCFFVLL